MLTQENKVQCDKDRVNVSVDTVKINHTNQDIYNVEGYFTLSVDSTKEFDDSVKIITGGNTMSNVCLEEGLADDDSWVDDMDMDGSDREEELRGYNRHIDFTLHTILEESGEEDSDGETKLSTKPTEFEKYYFGLAGIAQEDENFSDTESESSVVSDIVDEDEFKPSATSSRLEKYFLTSFLEASCAPDNTDESGSVGSDSEGRPSPETRRKKLVRARGAGRYNMGSDSMDPTDVSGTENNDDSTETDSYNGEHNFGMENAENMKRKKKKQTVRLITISSPPQSITENEVLAESEPEEGAKTPQPELPTEPPPPTQKHNSRDSGFIGSCDDLLKPSGSSSGGSDREVDLAATAARNELTHSTPVLRSPVTNVRLQSLGKNISIAPLSANLSRKDSFNNWSSDEETNLMMCKMRAFFKTMVAGGNKMTSERTKDTVKNKPSQLVYFESELTRLMKTVPGIKDEQVREIVEYLSSEDTWSDSYDSSDYTSSDLEVAAQTEIQQQISASCQEIIKIFDSNSLSECSDKEDVFMYQRLVESLSRASDIPSSSSAMYNSPPLIAKVMHHIGSRLVALMHEVSAAGEYSQLSSESNQINSPKSTRYRRVQRQQQSPIDKPDSAGGSDTEDATISRMRRHPSLPRSKSHDLGQWQQLLQEAERRAVPRESLRSSSSGVSDFAEEREDERYSWRGSFESALAADSRTKLELKRRSTGSGCGSVSDLFSNSDQLDRQGRVRSCGSIGPRTSLPGRAGTRLSSSGGDLLTATDNEVLLDLRRRSSVPESAINPRSTTLPRSNTAASASTNSLPRLPLSASPVVAAIHKSYSAQLHVTGNTQQSSNHPYHHQYLQNAKSARYRAPNFRPPSLGPPKRAVSSPGLHQVKKSRIGSKTTEEDEENQQENGLVSISASVSRSESMASVCSNAKLIVRGQVEFALQYNYKQQALEIYIKQCRDLAPVDTKRNRSDPYVKLYLLPDKSKSGKRKTKVKKHTLNPIFDETLKYFIKLEEVKSRKLWLTVLHSDMFGRNDFLGQVIIPLENKVFDDPSPHWYTLEERTESLEESQSNKGELIIGMKFVPPDTEKNKNSKGSLHVLIKEAKNLVAGEYSNPFCKSYLLPEKGRGSKQKTNIARRTCNPVWNHTIIYEDTSLEDLTEKSLELSIWNHDLLSTNEFIGIIRFNLGTGKYYGKNVDWMDATGKEITLWKQMIDRPNFWVEGCVNLRSSNC